MGAGEGDVTWVDPDPRLKQMAMDAAYLAGVLSGLGRQTDALIADAIGENLMRRWTDIEARRQVPRSKDSDARLEALQND